MRVLLAVDGSNDAKAATEALRHFPLPEGSTLTILSVASILRSPIGISATTVQQFVDAARAQARADAEQARTVLGSRFPKAEIRIGEAGVHGDVREEIIRATEEADLVVLGARGLGAVRSFLLGSVSTAVARHAHCSVLVVKRPSRRFRNIVGGVDGSKDSLAAVRFLASLGDLRRVNVRLLGVLEKTRFPSAAPTALRKQLIAAVEMLDRERQTELERVVAEAGIPLKGQVAALDTTTVAGVPAEDLLRVANRPGCDLIVVGARGLGVVKRLLLGSVSEKVLRHARCSVLIVKQTKGEPRR